MSLKQILQSQIAVVTRSWGLEMAEIPLRNLSRSSLTPLKQGETGEEVLKSCVSYRCAVALQIAPRKGISAGEIAEKLVLELANLQVLDGQNFEVQAQVMDQGIISLGISDRALAYWLEHLRLQPSSCPEINAKIDLIKLGEINYFPIQAAHARCCSLLKLATREKVIQLRERSRDQLLAPWQIYLPSAIPWLDPEGKFRLVTPQEQYLVNLLVNLVDEFDSSHNLAQSQKQHQKWLKLATEISLGLANFYRYNRIFREISINNLPLAQARLGLVALTRWGLERLLREYLGAIAPPEL